MQIIVHRGTHQIGGCATEIRTDNARILIDFGAALPDSNGHNPNDILEINGLNIGNPNFDGVFLTHYHGDHLGLIGQIPAVIPIYMGRDALDIFSAYADRINNSLSRTAEHIRPVEALLPLRIGDLTVTPIPTDHSAYGAFMYLVEGEGKRILHTGDFRLHGFRSKATPKLLACYAADVDVLIIEGTQLSRSGPSGLSERELQERFVQEVRTNKYVFALCASTHIDRLASLYHATPKGRYFLCDNYQKGILERVAANTDSRWYQFQKALIYGENLNLQNRGFVMPVRANRAFSHIVSRWPEAILIYSMWDGYLDGRATVLSDITAPFAKTGRLLKLHSSGHAKPQDLLQMCEWIKPRIGIIPIHTGHREGLDAMSPSCPILYLDDREVLTL